MAEKKNSRSAHGSGTIRKRPDGRWEARYTIGRDPGSGKQIQKSLYADSQKEALKLLKQVQADIENGSYTAPSKLTVAQWLDIWLAEYNNKVKPRTLNLYTGQCDYRIKPALGAVKLSALKPHEIQAFLNQQGKEASGKPALSPKSIKNLHGILHKALQTAKNIGYIKQNPADTCILPLIEKREIKPLDNEKIAAFLAQICGHPYEALFKVALFTGLRQSEVIGLTWNCVQESTLYIYRQLQLIKGEYRFTSLKNKKARRITPAGAIMQVLDERKREQSTQRLKAGAAWCNDEGFIFTDALGKHLAYTAVYKQFKQLAKEIGIPTARFHDLRHTYAVASLQAGDDPKTVQENLGHHTAAFTLDVYGHVTEQMKQESASRMDAFIKKVTG